MLALSFGIALKGESNDYDGYNRARVQATKDWDLVVLYEPGGVGQYAPPTPGAYLFRFVPIGADYDDDGIGVTTAPGPPTGPAAMPVLHVTQPRPDLLRIEIPPDLLLDRDEARVKLDGRETRVVFVHRKG